MGSPKYIQELCNADVEDQPEFLTLCKVSLTEDGKVPEWVMLMPAGKVTAVDGRKWNNSDPQAVVAQFDATDLDLPFDWEHATEVKAPEGDRAPASGWITKLEVREGAIWAQVEWTAAGEADLLSKSYRYISPAFLRTVTDGVVVRITSAGLTNTPAMDQLPAVARETPGKGASKMNPEQLAALGLKADASSAEILATIQTMRASEQKMAAELTSVRKDLETSQGELVAARAAAPSLDKFAPRADYDAVCARAETAEASLASQKKEAVDNEITGEIASALKAGKITPATADYHRTQCAQEGGLAHFKKYVQDAPVIAPPSNLGGNPPPGGDQTVLTATQQVIASQCGVTSEQFLAAQKS